MKALTCGTGNAHVPEERQYAKTVCVTCGRGIERLPSGAWMTGSAKHAPKDVYETREDYRCGVCGEPVDRYSAPRARWVHVIPD